MALDTRELFARLIQCEAGGEGEYGMAAVATVVMNRATATAVSYTHLDVYKRQEHSAMVRNCQAAHAKFFGVRYQVLYP